ncbi:hypothetical protein ACFWCA_50205 [Streptomyces phaeochromogenes]|uniref:hypothetical protein n=1 Tax=Streptomyces phaeochromogenes TaxID=1923 RepID=UPI0036981AF4
MERGHGHCRSRHRVYTIGLALVQWDASEAESGAGSSPAVPCGSLPPGALDQLAGHEPSYFPLGFNCLLDGGRVVAASGPYSLLNVLAAAFALAAVLSMLAAGILDEFRARAQTKARLVDNTQETP